LGVLEKEKVEENLEKFNMATDSLNGGKCDTFVL
jgi:hypothetical protein